MVDPLNKIGCNAKLPFHVLCDIVPKSNVSSLDKDWGDFTPLAGGGAFSIDTVGILSGRHLKLSAVSAINHCTNDIIIGGYAPSHVGLSVAINPEEFDIVALKSFVSSVNETCQAYGAKLGKSHSIYGTDNYVSIVSIGQQRLVPAPIKKDITYDVILTKKLGAFRAFVLNFYGEHSDKIEDEASASMLVSHIRMLEVLKHMTQASTDVSGNGLLGALYLLSSKHSLSITIDVKDLRLIGVEFGDTSVACGSKNNRDSFRKFIRSSDQLPPYLDEVLYTPEYSGPIILLIENAATSEALSNLCDAGLADAHKIGIANIAQEAEVKIAS